MNNTHLILEVHMVIYVSVNGSIVLIQIIVFYVLHNIDPICVQVPETQNRSMAFLRECEKKLKIRSTCKPHIFI